MAFTFFFRDQHTLEQVLKYFIPLVSGSQKIKIWDAGCAMGQEPYTFAILLAEKLGYFAFKNVHIDATDIDEGNTFGKIIEQGIYPYNELNRIPENIFKKYFHPTKDPNLFQLDENIRKRVKFTKNNLLDLSPIGWNYNLIICKNVLLHFHPEERVNVIKMFHKTLDTKGLFVTEQTQPMPEECADLFKKIAPDANIFQKRYYL